MLLKALKPWFNADHEGHVEPGQEIDPDEDRANELIRTGLAVAVVGVGKKIEVPHDEPEHPKKPEHPEPRRSHHAPTRPARR